MNAPPSCDQERHPVPAIASQIAGFRSNTIDPNTINPNTIDPNTIDPNTIDPNTFRPRFCTAAAPLSSKSYLPSLMQLW